MWMYKQNASSLCESVGKVKKEIYVGKMIKEFKRVVVRMHVVRMNLMSNDKWFISFVMYAVHRRILDQLGVIH